MNPAATKDPTIIATAIVYGALLSVATYAGLFGIWLGVLLLISLGRYCYAILRAAAQGRIRFPAVTIESFNPVGDINVLGHLLLFSGLTFLSASWQPGGLIIAFIAAIAFPASAAMMGLTGNLLSALNPRHWITVATAIGREYVLLVLVCAALGYGVIFLFKLVVPQLPVLSTALGLSVEVWALLVSFSLIGSVIRTHRRSFEIPGELLPVEDQQIAIRDKQWREDLDRAYASIRSDLIESGYATLHRLINDNEDSLDINHWLIENLFEWEEKKYAIEVAEKLIPRLISGNKTMDALKLYQRCRHYDDGFALPQEVAALLAEQAKAIGQAGLADELLHG